MLNFFYKFQQTTLIVISVSFSWALVLTLDFHYVIYIYGFFSVLTILFQYKHLCINKERDVFKLSWSRLLFEMGVKL